MKRKIKRKIGILAVLLVVSLACAAAVWQQAGERTGFLMHSEKPEDRLLEYMDYVSGKEYEKMYEMLASDVTESLGRKEFVERNQGIYEGIQMKNMKVSIIRCDEERHVVTYHTSFDTAAGNVQFETNAVFKEEDGVYRLLWEDSLIVPELGREDKVRVISVPAKRGRILDRNGVVLAGQGTASSVGIVPGKLKDRKKAGKRVAELLGMKQKEIENKLTEKWVREDSFVPLQTRPGLKQKDLAVAVPEKKIQKEKKVQEELLKIPGVMISKTQVREYPLKEAAAHLTGYVQSVTAQDLEEHAGEGYTAASRIGKTGLEGLFEKELKGSDGCRIILADAKGEEKAELAETAVTHGADIRLTIDAVLQSELYEAFKKDKSCSVAVSPYTGEVLALVSTPSFDNNAFILGMSQKEWKALNEDADKPLYNRFRQAWCPGSTLKPIIAAIGLETGAVNPAKDYGSEGLRWQKDKSWGTYYVTTLHTYHPVTLENALIYSDNIFFAKTALRVGAERMEQAFTKLGFHAELPFEIVMHESQFSNTGHIEGEVALADSGYGQGQLLVNPLHLACLYSAFCNEGSVIKPYLVSRGDTQPEYWMPGACSKETAVQVLEGLSKVVNSPAGTGYAAHREGVALAGKTGTAEIKASKGDTSGTELGWFAVLTKEREQENPILIVSMVEDVKHRGGSGYVVRKVNPVLEKWFRHS